MGNLGACLNFVLGRLVDISRPGAGRLGPLLRRELENTAQE
jgi:hypothetical protein